MNKNDTSIGVCLANLIEYAKNIIGLDNYDSIYAHNQLISLFNLNSFSLPENPIPEFQQGIMDKIIDYSVKNGLIGSNEKLTFETKLLGLVTPSPSSVVRNFDSLAASRGTKAATNYLNSIGWASNYLRKKDIDKNIVWKSAQPGGSIIISINLAKPEKDNKQVAAQSKATPSGHPKCPICLENLGLSGKRDTLRLVPLFLNDEAWFLQYSPYVYFEEHCIAVSEEHRPMRVDRNTFQRLLEFVEMFPHYFMGSNADLPIVGGSILSHEHYQGGGKVLPMFERNAKRYFTNEKHPGVSIAILDWYNSVIKLTSLNKKELIEQANEILLSWREYSDDSANILSKTTEQHNTITIIATSEGNNGFCLYLILRNNRTDETHPFGIFHPTEDMHNIKKEGIGLIEAMGLFILPGRLKSECDMITEILTGVKPLNFAEISAEDHPLCKHLGMLMQLANDHGLALSKEAADTVINSYISNMCIQILECTAVYKNTEEGNNAFDMFLLSMGLSRK